MSTCVFYTRAVPLPFSRQADWARSMLKVRSSGGKLTYRVLTLRLDAIFNYFCMRMSSSIDLGYLVSVSSSPLALHFFLGIARLAAVATQQLLPPQDPCSHPSQHNAVLCARYQCNQNVIVPPPLTLMNL